MRYPPTPHVLLGGLLAVLLTAAALFQPGLSPEVQEALDTVLLDEYRSEAAYQRVVDDHGEVRPFIHIVRAERRHAERLLDLYARYDLTPPENPHRAATSPGYASRVEACAASIDAERANAALYDDALALDLPDDVRGVLEHNRMASLEHHLPAFERCAGTTGTGQGRANMRGRMGRGQGPGHGSGCAHQGGCDGASCRGSCGNGDCPRR